MLKGGDDMSLICVKCSHIIVMSDNPDHCGVCHDCFPSLTAEDETKIDQSSKEFAVKSRAASRESSNSRES